MGAPPDSDISSDAIAISHQSKRNGGVYMGQLAWRLSIAEISSKGIQRELLYSEQGFNIKGRLYEVGGALLAL